MQLKNFIKSFDQFGINVGLHFGHWISKEKGRDISYKTYIGGIASIFSNACFFAASWIFFMQMINYGLNNVTPVDYVVDWQTLSKE